jgi:hypothetical protein
MNKSNIDFSYFISQIVTEVNTEDNLPLGISFNKGGLIIECPWRLRKEKEIIIGTSDCNNAPDRYSKKTIKQILMDKIIVGIDFYEGFSLLVINFEGNLSLHIFHDSNFFEGWQLNGDNGFDLISYPGGF